MSIKIRFFARFRELLGTDIEVEGGGGSTLGSIVKNIAQKSRDGHDAIFDGQGKSREFVILMRNGKRVGTIDADSIPAEEGVEIAVFPSRCWRLKREMKIAIRVGDHPPRLPHLCRRNQNNGTAECEDRGVLLCTCLRMVIRRRKTGY